MVWLRLNSSIQSKGKHAKVAVLIIMLGIIMLGIIMLGIIMVSIIMVGFGARHGPDKLTGGKCRVSRKRVRCAAIRAAVHE